MMEQELVVMEIICNAGEARSLSYEALRLSREQDFEAADEKLSQARECINKAHLIQTQLIEEDQGEGKSPDDVSDGACSRSPNDYDFGSRDGCRNRRTEQKNLEQIKGDENV